ncbi:YbjN domain-containing protein [Ornithinimicrobium pekingense]|uniref:YbjN domain-containing protein n=1 Tax=Ornithinimicrobium pekingense TaxID=384677 RepID=A0ABQ2FDK3_9MICO|nr:YbjN domain-containing protein [Ornithinimicrobium pekingense]GGK76991.1 hypothetical protein GCM10011509_27030 [Ornithinimicrobium pekingense]
MSGPDALGRLRDQLLALGLEVEDGAHARELVVTLPGERKLRTVASLVVGDRALEVRAFVVRNPDENHEQVYRYLLRRGLRMPGLAYAVDSTGDVFVTGRVLLAGLDDQAVDELMGAVLTACDEPFDELLRLGFWTSIRREWAWRRARGEPTRNLEAFRAELEALDAAGDGIPGPRESAPGPQ